MGINEHQNYVVGVSYTCAVKESSMSETGRRGQASGRFACLACPYSLNVLEERRNKRCHAGQCWRIDQLPEPRGGRFCICRPHFLKAGSPWSVLGCNWSLPAHRSAELFDGSLFPGSWSAAPCFGCHPAPIPAATNAGAIASILGIWTPASCRRTERRLRTRTMDEERPPRMLANVLRLSRT